MKRLTALGASILLLGGCALPLPVQVASWAIDGVLYVTTDKSLADHGISAFADMDCAMLRGVMNGGEFCVDGDGVTMVADADGGTPLGVRAETAAGVAETADVPADIAAEIEELANFETAAGTPDAFQVDVDDGVQQAAALVSEPVLFAGGDPLQGYPAVIGVPGGAREGAREGASEGAPEVAGKRPAAAGLETVADFDAYYRTVDWAPDDDAIEVAMTLTSMVDGDFGLGGDAEEPEAGLYFVIGSFREHMNARKLRRAHRALTPSVLAAKLDGGTVFRVVVGPFGQDQAKGVHQRIFDAGISDSWAIRVRPGEWSMALVDPPADAPQVVALETERNAWDPMVIVEMLARLML